MHLPIRAGARGAETTGRKRSVSGPKILLVIGGGIAAYKSCELVRLIRKAGGEVTCVLTDGGQQFVTPMALAALSENKVYTSLFDLKDEVEMGHIQLSREADLVVVCPATADLLAKMAAGIADDLATTLILATDKPVLTVPAMNVRMWEHSATQRNADWLRQAGVAVMDPDEGPMACGEFGAGRMPEPPSILARIAQELDLDLDLPELAAPAPAQLVAPLAGDMSSDEGPLSEDWAEEPETGEEAEDEAPSNGGLGGLLSMIIPRTTETRTHDEIEAELEALPEAEEEAATEEPLDLPAPDPAAGPILATKGKAAAAPPTDPSALAYDHGAGLQSVQTQSVTFENSPLAGPGAFD
ncbi:MAG: flavoprotein, partial [Pseudomonadota bacterium]|nr:flavoprotein [Pseudomonadota bacterium]